MREQSVSTKVAVTVSEMARMVGLSRARFYELVEAGVFMAPVYEVSTRRPMYDEKMQETFLEVRRRNCGVNGRPVLFYSRCHRTLTPTAKPPVAKPKATAAHADLIDGLSALGLVATPTQVGEAVAALYPTGVNGTDRGQVLRAVFLRLNASGHGG